MARYKEIADSLRERIQAGEWPVGSKLPAIAVLQEEYAVPGLNTIRAAQQLLVDEGMIVTRQGVGATVVSTQSLRQVDLAHMLQTAHGHLADASGALTTALAAMQAPQHAVTFDLTEENVYYVLTAALSEWADEQRFQAEHERDGDPENTTAADRTSWAAIADALNKRVEEAL